MPYSATLIAAVFVKKAIAEKKFITQMKLQKMVYFAHGYHLAKYGTPLVEENFQAWKFGPVIPEIYSNYKLYGSDYINDTRYASFLKSEEVDTTRLSESARDAIEYTWKATKNLTAAELSNWTHLPDSPWSKYYHENDREAVIENNSIKEYFKGFLSGTPA